jgi:hypothetical protein
MLSFFLGKSNNAKKAENNSKKAANAKQSEIDEKANILKKAENNFIAANAAMKKMQENAERNALPNKFKESNNYKKAAKNLFAANATMKKLNKNAKVNALFNNFTASERVDPSNEASKLRAKNLQKLKTNVIYAKSNLSQKLVDLKYRNGKQNNVAEADKDYEAKYQLLDDFKKGKYVPKVEPVINKPYPFNKPFENEMKQRELIYEATKNPKPVILGAENQALLNEVNDDEYDGEVSNIRIPLTSNPSPLNDESPMNTAIPIMANTQSPVTSNQNPVNTAIPLIANAPSPVTSNQTPANNAIPLIANTPSPVTSNAPSPAMSNAPNSMNTAIPAMSNAPMNTAIPVTANQSPLNNELSDSLRFDPIILQAHKNYTNQIRQYDIPNPIYSKHTQKSRPTHSKHATRDRRYSSLNPRGHRTYTPNMLEEYEKGHSKQKTRRATSYNHVQEKSRHSYANRAKTPHVRRTSKSSRSKSFTNANSFKLAPLKIPSPSTSPLNVEKRAKSFKNKLLSKQQRKSHFAESPKRKLTPEQLHLAEKLKRARDALRAVGKPGRAYLQKEEALLIAYINFKLSLKK